MINRKNKSYIVIIENKYQFKNIVKYYIFKNYNAILRLFFSFIII